MEEYHAQQLLQTLPELERCVALNQYWDKGYKKWFTGYLEIAEETNYPLAECQVGYCYLEGIGTDKDIAKGIEYTRRSAVHGDRDAQYNLAILIEEGKVINQSYDDAIRWHIEAAKQDHSLAISHLQELHIKY